MRLYKYIKVNANKTQSEVKILFENNLVTVNDKLVQFTYLIKENDVVKIGNDIIEMLPKLYYLYYKPKGVISDIKDKNNSYINFINSKYKLMPCGRLDKESEGLMILTNDGMFINDILNNDKEKYTLQIFLLSISLFIKKAGIKVSITGGYKFVILIAIKSSPCISAGGRPRLFSP